MCTAGISLLAIAANDFTSFVLSETLCPADIKSGFVAPDFNVLFVATADVTFFRRYIQSLSLLFTYIPFLQFTAGDWWGGRGGWWWSIMCPLTQRNYHFPADFEWVLSCDGLRSHISFLRRKWGMIKVPRQSFRFFIIYFLNVRSLLTISTTGSY